MLSKLPPPLYAKSATGLPTPVSIRSAFPFFQRRSRLLVVLLIINALIFLSFFSSSTPFSFTYHALPRDLSLQCKHDPTSTHPPTGQHYIVDMFGVDSDALSSLENDSSFTKVKAAIAAAGMTLLGTSAHRFDCGGLTAVFLLSESHVSIHSWPEHQFIAIDVYTCGLGKPAKIVHMFERFLKPQNVRKTLVERGLNRHSIRGKRPLPLGKLVDEGDDDDDDEDEDLDEPVFASQQASAAPLPPAPPPERSTDPRDLTFPRGEDVFGNKLADICVNGDDVDDDCYLLRNATVLFDQRSQFQRIEVVDSATLGRCMLLDRVVQFSELDNHIYTKNMVDPALQPVIDSAPAAISSSEQQTPFHVQMVGGGDGWIASYLLDSYSSRLPNLTISIVDIDPLVSKTTQQFFSPAGASNSFKDPRVEWHHASAPDHLKTLPSNSADLIVIDCTDPSAEAARVLYTPEFYSEVHRVLVPGGKVTQQMNTDHEDYRQFLIAAEKTWTRAGLVGLTKWTEYIASYGGRSVFWMAEKPTAEDDTAMGTPGESDD
ncbi:S-adenosyl-L-methionine-dependent methyltransferase [Cladochytrium replicatum]|nr:S-adenosyl-L-methionine-dependent methyltransferase [Cladochytrium replicatum]